MRKTYGTDGRIVQEVGVEYRRGGENDNEESRGARWIKGMGNSAGQVQPEDTIKINEVATGVHVPKDGESEGLERVDPDVGGEVAEDDCRAADGDEHSKALENGGNVKAVPEGNSRYGLRLDKVGKKYKVLRDTVIGWATTKAEGK